MRRIFIIWKKELKDTVRDRRTLLSMIILPMLLMPLLIVGLGKYVEFQIKQQQEQEVKLAFIGSDRAPALVDFFKGQKKIVLVEMAAGAREAVKSQKLDAAIEIPPDFSGATESYRQVSLPVIRNSINEKSSTALQRISQAVSAFNSRLFAERFAKNSIPAAITNGLTLAVEDVASEQERGGFGLGFLLPLFIVMWSIVGGQYTAIDVSAGEKERKTLESLLLAPVRRLDIVLGKFLAVSTAALISVVISLSSLYFAVARFGFSPTTQTGASASAGAGISFDFSFEPAVLAVLLAVSLLLVAMFSAVLLSIAIFAKSYKEAQSYIGPAYLVVILPVVLINTVPGLKAALWLFAVPAVNAVLLFKEVMIGVFDGAHIAVTLLSLVVFSVAAILAASYIYSKEGVLFRD